ncbi:hypothetical protein SESBI_18762 [Sesbania bispinosa]|nr:hypothetical protein SESBI_18762 [Sesbania bispinosa]
MNGTSKCLTLGDRRGELPPVLDWSRRVLNDLPLTVKKVVNHLEEIHIVHPKNVSQLQPTNSPVSLSKNQPYLICSRNANQVTHWGHGS